MAFDLYLGNRAYSSWSLRAWLIFDQFGIGYRLHLVDFSREEDVAAQIGHPPARTVPTLVTEDGAVVHDSLALAEELATRHADLAGGPRRRRRRSDARGRDACGLRRAPLRLPDEPARGLCRG